MSIERSSAAKAFIALKQQLMGVKAAALNRPLRVPANMWKRGGKRKPGAPEITQWESAYRQFARGRQKALENRALTSREERSEWCVLGFYSTSTVMDMLGGEANDRFTDPARRKKATDQDDIELDDIDLDDEAELTNGKPSWFEPGHSIPYEDDFTGFHCTITVSDDGERLVCESREQRRGEPRFSDNNQINRPTGMWAQFYFTEAQKAGATLKVTR